jgi:hypothetical protein
MKLMTSIKQETDPRYVKFDYFQVKISDKKSINSTHAKVSMFDLTKWMDLIRPLYELDPIRVTMNYSGEQIRCDATSMVGVDTASPFARLHFTKLREKNVPAVGSLKDVKLENVTLREDEYIAEDITALFDPSNYVLMLQKNIYSLSRGAITEYINFFWNQGKDDKDKQFIQLIPILEKGNFTRGKQKNKFKKISFQTANKISTDSSASYSNPFSGTIGSLFDSMKPLKGLNIDITISTSRSKDDVLERSEVLNLLKEIENSQSLIKDANISYLEEKEGTGNDYVTSYMDLIKGKVQSKLLFDVPKKEKLDEDAVWTEMLAEYRSDGNNMQHYVNNNINW